MTNLPTRLEWVDALEGCRVGDTFKTLHRGQPIRATLTNAGWVYTEDVWSTVPVRTIRLKA